MNDITKGEDVEDKQERSKPQSMVDILGQRRMEQLKVSTAAVKSRRKIVRKPESEERRRSLVTLSSAVSVLR